ncbi:hypothetical protein BMA10399_E0070 [Burkholderia mallei ATCC 10399]|nr:hypothetical protein BMA10399_E0070 [Burkholderia mallei ATCC 10399]
MRRACGGACRGALRQNAGKRGSGREGEARDACVAREQGEGSLAAKSEERRAKSEV